MYIEKLDIFSFRNLKNVKLEFSRAINFIFGDNAQGKTNLIETIYILCLAKSFRSRDDSELIPFKSDFYSFDGYFIDETAISSKVAVYYTVTQGKKIKIDGKNINQYSTLVGRFPIVVLSTEDHIITTGPPAQRRKFFNILLSQGSSRYLDDLKKYERILKQKNKILNYSGDRSHLKEQVDIWNAQLVQTGTNLMLDRAKMVEEINGCLAEYYKVITRSDHTLKITYQPCVPIKESQTIPDTFKALLSKVYNKEVKRGLSLIGPHRDEFKISVAGNELRKYGSRGEHKSALVSLKAAEAEFLQKKTDTNPILLLDDLYSELDIERGKRVLELFTKSCQIFITGTSLDFEAIKKTGFTEKDHTTFIVKSGNIARA
ncbi:DNA replication/repair protein RecF [candidate division KSB1 bacterium]|nr:DNA replication/repair protein RecF [candidate division KSB1 bacterium]